MEEQLYFIIGEDGFRRLTHAFYSQVPRDEILGPMYPPEDLAGAEKRLADFLIFLTKFLSQVFRGGDSAGLQPFYFLGFID